MILRSLSVARGPILASCKLAAKPLLQRGCNGAENTLNLATIDLSLDLESKATLFQTLSNQPVASSSRQGMDFIDLTEDEPKPTRALSKKKRERKVAPSESITDVIDIDDPEIEQLPPPPPQVQVFPSPARSVQPRQRAYVLLRQTSRPTIPVKREVKSDPDDRSVSVSKREGKRRRTERESAYLDDHSSESDLTSLSDEGDGDEVFEELTAASSMNIDGVPTGEEAFAAGTSRQTDISAGGLSKSTASGTNNAKPLQPQKKKAPLGSGKKYFTAPQALISACLQTLTKHIIVPPPETSFGISRQTLYDNWRGALQHFFQYLNTGRRLVYPKNSLNPYLPQSPGNPGALFSARHELLQDNDPWSVFVDMKKKTKKPQLWLYLGEYRIDIGPKVDETVFRQQSKVVQDEWTKRLGKSKWPCYMSMRARIWLRKTKPNEAVTDDAVADTMDRMKDKDPAVVVSENDIKAALLRGDEQLDVLKMQCVGYDHDFVKEMQRVSL